MVVRVGADGRAEREGRAGRDRRQRALCLAVPAALLRSERAGASVLTMATARRSPLTILLLLVRPACVRAGNRLAARRIGSAESSRAESSSTEPPKPRSDCAGETPIETEGIDTMRAGLERGVCSTARFVDGVFGRENQEFAEYDDESSGRASVTVGWNEQDSVEVDTRFRASVNLPQINERFNATIGKRQQRRVHRRRDRRLQSGGRCLLRRRPGGVVRGRRLPRAPRRGTAASTSAPA